MVNLTEAAARKILQLIKENNMPDGSGFRFGAVSGGCSGFQYDLGLAETPKPNDTVYDCEVKAGEENLKVKVFVDERCLELVDETVIDYGKDPFGHNLSKNFIIRNPNEKGSCGCGKSFTV